MNNPSSKRMLMARKMAEVYSRHPEVRAMIVTGSVANGVADDGSDIDMILYYDQLPSEEEIKATRLEVGGSERLFFVGDPAEGSCVESYRIEGIKHDFAHVTIETWQRDMAEVLEQHKVDSPIQKALAGLLDAVPLIGEDLIRQWQAQAAAYPQPLAEAMVKAHLRFYPQWVPLDQAAKRDDLLFLYEIFTEAGKNILGVLLGLNRIYHWGEYKRMDSFIGQMAIAPKDLSSRLKQVLREEPVPATEKLGVLIEEVFALVETHMPDLDISAAKRRFFMPPQ
jgi:predicted nucleotidyltransferase